MPQLMLALFLLLPFRQLLLSPCTLQKYPSRPLGCLQTRKQLPFAQLSLIVSAAPAEQRLQTGCSRTRRLPVPEKLLQSSLPRENRLLKLLPRQNKSGQLALFPLFLEGLSFLFHHRSSTAKFAQ